jgi:hypothetical protein
MNYEYKILSCVPSFFKCIWHEYVYEPIKNIEKFDNASLGEIHLTSHYLNVKVRATQLDFGKLGQYKKKMCIMSNQKFWIIPNYMCGKIQMRETGAYTWGL